MRATSKRTIATAGAAALCALLAACGSGGGGGDDGNGLPPFQAASTDELPSGARIDVASKKLFQMGAGDFWQYTVLDANGNPAFITASRQVTSDDGAGHVTLVDNDGGSDTTTYTVSADGLLDPHPLGSAPASMASIVGGIFEYATPLYPVGAVRRHVRSGPWGADLDGDGIGDSFRLELTQVFLGFESLQLSPFFTLKDVAHFHNVFVLTQRPTGAGNTDYTITATEDTWFAPGMGLMKAQRTAVDSDGFTLEVPHTIVFSSGSIAGANWNVLVPPPPPIDGSFVDVALAHNALVYDSVRNVYYASVPGSVIGNGNSIATIDPTTGQVSYSAPVGSEPNALAIAADASALYVGTDGSGDVVKLALPSMAEQGRTKLVNDMFFGQTHAQTIAVSPASPNVVAVSMAYTGVSPAHAGVALLRNMVLQPTRTQSHTGSNLIAFDSAGTKLYGLNTGTTEFGLRRIGLLADGLAEELVVAAASDFSTAALGFVNNRVIAGHSLYDAPALTSAGLVSTPSDCVPRRSGTLLLCFDVQSFNNGPARILIADSGTFVIAASPVFATSEPGGLRRLVEGQNGQVAISYPANIGFVSVSKIRLFTSAQLIGTPAPPAPSWPVAPALTADGTALDIGLVHNSLVYDSVRNVYYASVPGSVIGAGNSIAIIDPATGQVTHSAPVGSEPDALAIAADASVLYVGLDGSGEVERLALPSMTPQGRTRLVVDSFFGRARAESIAVSPADASVAAVSMAWFAGFSPRHAGVALLRDMVMQPNRTQTHTGSNLVTFDAAGTKVYGQNIETTEFGLRRIAVLADGLAEELVVTASTNFGTRALSFANGRVIDGAALYDAPALTAAGVISSAGDCWAARTGTGLLCFADPFAPGAVPGTVLVANSATFVIGASLRYSTAEPGTPRRLVQGPSGQIAVSYVPLPAAPSIRLFSSAQLP